MTAVDHKVNGIVVCHTFEPIRADTERNGGFACRFNDIFLVADRVERGEITDVFIDLAAKKRFAAVFALMTNGVSSFMAGAVNRFGLLRLKPLWFK